MSFLLRDARPFAEALFSDSAGPPPVERMDWLMAELEDFVDQAGPRVHAIVAGGLALATWAAPAFAKKAPPLSRLSIADRCRALDLMERSKMGLPLLGVKAILCILYYEHPDVLRGAGVIDASRDKPGCLS